MTYRLRQDLSTVEELAAGSECKAAWETPGCPGPETASLSSHGAHFRPGKWQNCPGKQECGSQPRIAVGLNRHMLKQAPQTQHCATLVACHLHLNPVELQYRECNVHPYARN